jgi:glutathione S-transferase
MLILYYKTTCPYCRKVLRFAETAAIKLELRDIYSDPQIMEDLITSGGKRQIPYLVDEENNVAMYESEDIIEYLKANYVR